MENSCINCGQPTSGKFCANCGQRLGVKRITFREAWEDFWARTYGFDGMFPRTLRDLTLRPGYATRDFLNGNRTKYYGPIGYFFFVIGLYVLVMSILKINPVDLVKAMGVTPKPGAGQEQFNSKMFSWINDNQRLAAFLMIPFYVLGAKIFFRKEKLNFLEHSVLVFYCQGHVQWLSILALFSFAWFELFPSFLFLIIPQVLLYSFACMQLYKAYRPLAAFMRGLLVNLFFWIFFVIIIVASLVIAMVLNPALLEQLPANK
jgi:Protein of unknown function (DUF3667)